MNCRSVVFFLLIALQTLITGCTDPQSAGRSEAVNDEQTSQKSAESEAMDTVLEIPKPSESEAIEAAVAYLNREGQLTIQETEFIAWGTYSEHLAYWPVKFRMVYKSKDSDNLRQNDYALKISKDLEGKWKAAQYYAWRTDF